MNQGQQALRSRTNAYSEFLPSHRCDQTGPLTSQALAPLFAGVEYLAQDLALTERWKLALLGCERQVSGGNSDAVQCISGQGAG